MSEAQLMSMIPYFIPLVVLQLALFIVALMKWVKKKTLPNRMIWLVVLFFQIIGPGIFLIYCALKGDEEDASN